eukprot:1632227-Pyramimonas_sp.AAC.1
MDEAPGIRHRSCTRTPSNGSPLGLRGGSRRINHRWEPATLYTAAHPEGTSKILRLASVHISSRRKERCSGTTEI